MRTPRSRSAACTHNHINTRLFRVSPRGGDIRDRTSPWHIRRAFAQSRTIQNGSSPYAHSRIHARCTNWRKKASDVFILRCDCQRDSFTSLFIYTHVRYVHGSSPFVLWQFAGTMFQREREQIDRSTEEIWAEYINTSNVVRPVLLIDICFQSSSMPFSNARTCKNYDIPFWGGIISSVDLVKTKTKNHLHNLCPYSLWHQFFKSEIETSLRML